MEQHKNITWANRTAFFLLCAILIFTTLIYGAVHQPIIAIVYLTAAALVVLWAVDSFIRGTIVLNRSLIQIPLLALFIYGMIQIIPIGSLAEIGGVSGIPRTLSLEPYWTKLTSFHILALAIFFAGFLTFINSAKRIRKIVLLITIFGFIYAFFAILQYFLSPNKIYGIYESPFAVPFGSFVNRHNFAAYMEMSMALPLGLLFSGSVPRDKRLLYLTAIGLMGIALLMSGSRGGLVSLLAEIAFLTILTANAKSTWNLVLKSGLAVLLVGIIIAGSILVGGESSLTRFAETASTNDITTNRTHIWSVTWDVIKNKPVLGNGIGAFDVAYSKFDTFNGMERVEQAHNDYLQVWADAGLVGLAIGIFFLYGLIRNGFQSIKTQNLYRRGVVAGAFAGCFAILVHSVFDFVLHTTAISLLFLVLVALLVNGGTGYPDDTEERMERHKRRKKMRKAVVTPFNKGKRKELERG
ncbi:MAG: O-antigen ligase family protein [Pyrinomonadaceae bacterium]